MSFVISKNEQRTPEWYIDRLGRATGSMAHCIVAKIKSGEAAARRDYRLQLVIERITGAPQEDFYQSPAMLWGIEHEDDMRSAYESKCGVFVKECGFIFLENIMAGCSVDGIVNDAIDGIGIIEGKCPKSATHLRYLTDDRLPADYEPQVTHNMYVTGASFCDFISYDPRMPANLQLFVKRINRDQEKIERYEEELKKFLDEVEEMTKTISSMNI